jgi:hypothetical protein
MHAGSLTPRPKARTPHRVRLKTHEAAKLAERYGLGTIQETADFFGLDATTWSRLMRGVIYPGEQAIAAVLGSHPEDPEITFEALFEVVPA